MTAQTQVRPIGAPDAPAPPSTIEKIEADGAVAALAVGEGLRAVEVAAVVLVGLLVCPPLAILAVVVVAPLLAIAVVLGLIAAVLSVPYLLVHHVRARDGRHAALLAHRVRDAGRALRDLAPHRIVAGARTVRSGR
jgi:hypothetical protein